MSRKRTKSKVVRTLVDIIIPVHNRFDILDECIKSIPEALKDIPYHIYIYDNGSERVDADKFYAVLDKSKVSITRSGINLGFPKACNSAFRKGRSPLVFFLNSDVILEPDSVDKLVRTMDDPGIGVAGMKLVFPTLGQTAKAKLDINGRPAKQLQHIGLVTNIRGRVGHAFSGWSADHPKVNAVSDIMAVTGAALMTRRILFSKLGMFWEGYGAGTWEDVDYCLTVGSTLFKADTLFRVIVVPEAVATHYTGATAAYYDIGFPMGENYQKFLLRWKGRLKQTDINVL